jgi:thiosulfate/3-mercaptopyruvate sulfurtransferase
MLNKPVVSVSWLRENLSKPNLVILDASTSFHAEKEDKGLIPGSIRIDFKKDFSDTSSEFPNTFPSKDLMNESARKLGIHEDSIVVVYDDKGIYTSPRIWWLFKTFGHKNVAVLDGGLPAWNSSDFEVVLEYKKVENEGDFEAELNENALKSYDEVVKNSLSQTGVLLDARSKGRFEGVDPEPRATLQSGSIPNSCSLAYTEVLANGHFKSEEDLKGVFSGLVNKNDSLIFSCGSGITACIILLAADLVLENEKTLFDGSWTEWAIKQNLTIETNG